MKDRNSIIIDNLRLVDISTCVIKYDYYLECIINKSLSFDNKIFFMSALLNNKILLDFNNEIWIWNKDEYTIIKDRCTYHGLVFAIISRDEIIVGTKEKFNMQIWNITTNKPGVIFKGHTSIITQVMYKNNKIITTSIDSTIKVWNIEGELLKSLEEDDSMLKCLCYFQNKFLCRSNDDIIRVWDLDTYKCDNLTGHRSKIRNLVTIGDKFLSTAYDGTMRIWDEKGCSLSIPVDKIKEKGVIVLSKDFVAVNINDKDLEIYNLNLEKWWETLLNFGTKNIVLSNGNLMGIYNGKINTFDLETDEYLSEDIENKDTINFISLLSNGQIVYCSDQKLYFLS